MVIVSVLNDIEYYLRKEIAIDIKDLKTVDVTLQTSDVRDKTSLRTDDEIAKDEENERKQRDCYDFYMPSYVEYFNRKKVFYTKVSFHNSNDITLYFSTEHDGIVAIQTILDAKGRYEWNVDVKGK